MEIIRRPRHGYPWDLRWESPPSNTTVRRATTLKVLRMEYPDGTPMPGYKKNGKIKVRGDNHK